MAQSSCKPDTKSKSRPGMKLVPVRVFSCKHPLSFLSHSACQYDVTIVTGKSLESLVQIRMDTTVIRTSEVEEKLRS